MSEKCKTPYNFGKQNYETKISLLHYKNVLKCFKEDYLYLSPLNGFISYNYPEYYTDILEKQKNGLIPTLFQYIKKKLNFELSKSSSNRLIFTANIDFIIELLISLYKNYTKSMTKLDFTRFYKEKYLKSYEIEKIENIIDNINTIFKNKLKKKEKEAKINSICKKLSNDLKYLSADIDFLCKDDTLHKDDFNKIVDILKKLYGEIDRLYSKRIMSIYLPEKLQNINKTYCEMLYNEKVEKYLFDINCTITSIKNEDKYFKDFFDNLFDFIQEKSLKDTYDLLLLLLYYKTTSVDDIVKYMTALKDNLPEIFKEEYIYEKYDIDILKSDVEDEIDDEKIIFKLLLSKIYKNSPINRQCEINTKYNIEYINCNEMILYNIFNFLAYDNLTLSYSIDNIIKKIQIYYYEFQIDASIANFYSKFNDIDLINSYDAFKEFTLLLTNKNYIFYNFIVDKIGNKRYRGSLDAPYFFMQSKTTLSETDRFTISETNFFPKCKKINNNNYLYADTETYDFFEINLNIDNLIVIINNLLSINLFNIYDLFDMIGFKYEKNLCIIDPKQIGAYYDNNGFDLSLNNFQYKILLGYNGYNWHSNFMLIGDSNNYNDILCKIKNVHYRNLLKKIFSDNTTFKKKYSNYKYKYNKYLYKLANL